MVTRSWWTRSSLYSRPQALRTKAEAKAKAKAKEETLGKGKRQSLCVGCRRQLRRQCTISGSLLAYVAGISAGAQRTVKTNPSSSRLHCAVSLGILLSDCCDLSNCHTTPWRSDCLNY